MGNDAILLRSYAASGDAGAFAELVRRYAGMVFATAHRVTGNTAVAEDVSQDCFLRLAQSSGAIRGSLAGWLHRTSLNRSLEMLRSERSRHMREAQSARAHSCEEPDDSAGLIRRVDEALASLPDEPRVLITEHFLCGRSQKELAEAMGLNQSTVHRRIESGLQQLRQRLKSSDDSPMALAALPLLLEQFGSLSVPQAVRQALTKIGLSGVGGAVATQAKRAVAWRILQLAFGVGGTIAGAALLFRAYGPVAWSAPDGTGTVVIASIDQVPAKVRRTLEELCPGATNREIERKPDGARTVYDLDVTFNGKVCEIRLADDGSLVWRRSN